MKDYILEVNCNICRGTGIIQTFEEPSDVAIFCHTCKGSGKRVLKYEPFNGLKKKKGIRIVVTKKFVKGKNYYDNEIPYDEFYSK